MLFLLFPFLSYASSSLQVVTDNTSVEAGKPIHVSIIAKNIDNNLSLININHLKNNFGLEIIESSNKSDGETAVQELKFDLYPRETGLTTIPSISFGGHKTTPIKISVNMATEINGTINFESSYNKSTVWQRQQILITASVITASKFARIELSDFNKTGVEIFKTEPTQVQLNTGQFKHTASWRLFPLLSGKQVFTPPSVNYRLSGKIQRKFFPPAREVNVKLLPSYIPPLMPVGKLIVNNSISPDDVWNIEVSSPDISPTSLASLTLPLDGITDIKLGEVITTAQSDDHFTHHAPLLFTNSRLIKLPSLVFKTFNPITGKIVTQRTEDRSFIVISTWLKIALAVILTFIIYKLVFKLLRCTNSIINRNKKITTLINSIPDAKSPQELHAILNSYAEIQEWGSNLSLHQWSAIWSQKKTHSADTLINELSLACYSRDLANISQTELNKKVCELINQ